jgi:hypothetical protein
MRIRPNRTDTSWAEEYTVRAAPPLKAVLGVPRRVRGPWTLIGWLLGDRVFLGKWRIKYGLAVEAPAGDEGARSFDDTLGELADAWRRSSIRTALGVPEAARRRRGQRRQPARRRPPHGPPK